MLKVLIVDDEAPIRQWLEYCISQFEGFTVVGSAGNGCYGLELYKEKKPDVVITDIEMPDMNGLEMMRLMQQVYSAYMIILTSHEDFSYARQALKQGTAEYVLKTELTVQIMKSILNKALLHIKGKGETVSDAFEPSVQQILLKMAQQQGNVKITDELLERKGITLKNGPLLCIDIWSEEEEDFSKIRDFFRKSSVISNVSCAKLEDEHMLVVGNLQDENDLSLLIECCEKYLKGLRCVMGISDVVRSLKNLPEAVKIAGVRRQSFFYQPDQWIFQDNTAGMWELRHIEMKKSFFSKALFQRHYKEAIEIKEETLKEIKEKQPMNLDAVRELCGFFVKTLLYFVMDCTEDIELEIEKAEIKIKKSKDVEQLCKGMSVVLEPIETTFLKRGAYSQPVQEAINYIEKCYAQKLSLNMVANHVAFNPEYFCRMFVRETGVNLVTYINNLRMTHAMELLENTDKKVYRIAEETGFSSVSYFMTAFKKHFGQTPNEYRSSYSKK